METHISPECTDFAFLMETPAGWISNFISGEIDHRYGGLSIFDEQAAALFLENKFDGDVSAFNEFLFSALRPGLIVTPYHSASEEHRALADKKMRREISDLRSKSMVVAARNNQDTQCQIHRIH